MEEPALGAKGLDGAEAHVFQRGRHGLLGPVAQIALLAHDVQHWGGEDVGGVEQRHAMAVGHSVKADDGAVDEFFHNIRYGVGLSVESLQFLQVPQLIGCLGAAAVIGLDDDRVAHLFDEGLGRRQRADHMVARHRHTGCNVAFLHLALVFDALDEVVLCTGGDVKVGAHLGIHFQPIFVVGFQPVDLTVMEGEIGHSPQHLIVIAQVVHAVILGQAMLELPGDLVKRCIADAQHIGAVAMQAFAEIPVGFGEMRADKHKIHSGYNFLFSITPGYILLQNQTKRFAWAS